MARLQVHQDLEISSYPGSGLPEENYSCFTRTTWTTESRVPGDRTSGG